MLDAEGEEEQIETDEGWCSVCGGGGVEGWRGAAAAGGRSGHLITLMAFALFQCHKHAGKSDAASFTLDSLIISIHQQQGTHKHTHTRPIYFNYHHIACIIQYQQPLIVPH